VCGQRQSTCRTTQALCTQCAKRQQHGIHTIAMCAAIRTRAARALHTSCGCTTTAVLQRGRRPSASMTPRTCKLVTRSMSGRGNSGARLRHAEKTDFLRFVAVEPEIICRRPRLQVFNLLLAGGRVAAWNDQICGRVS